MVGQDASRYQSTLPEGHIEQISRWHERAYTQELAEGRSDRLFDYLGVSILVPPEVMPITPMSHLLGEAVLADTHEGERVLDMGTGSGVNAILSATRGAHVLAVDINPRALQAAQDNVDRNGFTASVEVRASDVFSNVDGAFDLIVFDPPFRWFRPRDLVESAMADEDYRAMTMFIQQARRHLTPSGRMLLFFGTSGDLGYLQSLMADEGFAWEVVAHDDLTREDWKIDYFTFRVS